MPPLIEQIVNVLACVIMFGFLVVIVLLVVSMIKSLLEMIFD